jgi:hypothetical protein
MVFGLDEGFALEYIHSSWQLLSPTFTRTEMTEQLPSLYPLVCSSSHTPLALIGTGTSCDLESFTDCLPARMNGTTGEIKFFNFAKTNVTDNNNTMPKINFMSNLLNILI